MSTTSPATLLEYDQSVDATSDPLWDAQLALKLQDACNPVAIMGVVHRMALRIYASGGDTPTVEWYPAVRLIQMKLADLLHMPTSIREFEECYWMCKAVEEQNAHEMSLDEVITLQALYVRSGS